MDLFFLFFSFFLFSFLFFFFSSRHPLYRSWCLVGLLGGWGGYTRKISQLGAVGLETVAGVMDVVVRGGLYGIQYRPAWCSQICLAVNMELYEVGICSRGRVVVGGVEVELSGYWRLGRGELS